jgi:hypothetical protein
MVTSAFKKWEPASQSPTVVVGSPKLEREKVVGSRSDFVLGPHGGERHGVFARGAFHLIQGSSGVGKTTIGIQMLRAQQQRKWFFDREGQGRPFFIIWQDRSRLELERQLENMHMLEDPPPFHATSSDEAQRDPAKVIEEILLAQPERPEVLLVEGIDLWCQDAKDMKHVGTLATAIRDVAEHYHVAIIGTVGMPKMKPREQYAAPRDRAFGSSAWARKADTILDMIADQDTGEVTCRLLPRTGRQQVSKFEFEDGLLVPKPVAIDVVINGNAQAGPTIRELMKKHRCRYETAVQIRDQMGNTGNISGNA